ncbi:MAG: AAA family ATPase [Micromonosporaceae bacterium]|nr:AAA family ATPase [Micromonosporaceae bacterium]
MVGRDTELTELVEAWSQVAGTSESRVAVITGGPGTGKTLLVATALRQLARQATSPNIVLTGAARVHSPAPYDWLAAVLSAHDAPDLPAPADALAWLAQHPDAPRERYPPDALLRMAVRVVRGLVDEGPAVLVVEDLHALDPASPNLIGELATAPRLPALLLVTARQPADEVAVRALTRLCGVPGAVRLHLGALTATEVGEVLRRAWPEVSADAILAVAERTRGNPYLVKELVATTHHEKPPPPADLTAREVEVLGCLADGMSNKQVARSLGISIRTVAVHVSNLLRKTRTSSRTEAALWAVRHQLARPRP